MASSRIVIFGASGQLGEELARRLPEAIPFDRSTLDVTDSARLRDALAGASVAFNATSYNRVDAAEGSPTEAFAVNALAVREMAIACRDGGVKLVHFSTNYVFGADRDRREPYREDDAVGPINAYGVSKRIGEDFAQAICPDSLILRTAALFGPSRKSRFNFLENMLAKAQAGQTVRIVNDQTVSPTTTADLASAAIDLAHHGASGLYHINGPEPATWYELAREFLTRAGLADRVQPTTTTDIGAPANRPIYSVMDIAKYAAMGFAPD